MFGIIFGFVVVIQSQLEGFCFFSMIVNRGWGFRFSLSPEFGR